MQSEVRFWIKCSFVLFGTKIKIIFLLENSNETFSVIFEHCVHFCERSSNVLHFSIGWQPANELHKSIAIFVVLTREIETK